MANGNRYNLLNSTVLELMEYIRRENFKTLIAYLVENYSHQLEKIDYVDTFQQLKQIYEQSLEGHPPSDVSGGGKDHGGFLPNRFIRKNAIADPRKRNDDRALEKEEEDYFNEDSDDEEDSTSAPVSLVSSQHTHAVIGNGNVLDSSPVRVGLVSYEDEDDNSPLPVSSSQGPECVKSENSISSLPTNDSLGHEMNDSSKAKRKRHTADSNENEQEAPKKQRRPVNSKDHGAPVDAVDKVQKNQESSVCNQERSFGDPVAMDSYGGVERSTEKGDSLVSTDPNGSESSITKARHGSGNEASLSIPKQGSGSDRPDIGVEKNFKQDKPNEDGPNSACIEVVVREALHSPGPNSVQ